MVLLKVDSWMNINDGDSKPPAEKAFESSTDGSTLETVLATMTALVEENRMMRGQLTELSSEVRRLATAQEEQRDSAVKVADTVASQPKGSDSKDGSKGAKAKLSSSATRVNSGSSSSSSNNDSDFVSTMRTLKPMGPPTVRRAASIDRPAAGTRSSTPVRRPPPSPKVVLQEPIAEFEL